MEKLIEKLSIILSDVIYDFTLIEIKDNTLICDIYGDFHYRATYEYEYIRGNSRYHIAYMIISDYKKFVLKQHFNLDKINL